MGFRITTWNVNGIRNPFSYQPWSTNKTFARMFEILDADIVVMQECKIQKKDLKDDMVLVPGWDVFFSLPKQKKGYSGVAIYTRNATCAPIRAEEGITGLLCPPNSSTSYCNLPEETQIGGYPRPGQLSECEIDPMVLDSEGRCMILEFPAFVLIGVYFPANSMGDRDDFRMSWIIALDVRIRNLIALGKRVVLTGDLNISREIIDAATAEEQLRKEGKTADDYVSFNPVRRMFNDLLVDGKVLSPRDEARKKGVLWDLCRLFHPERKAMFTCWEQKINARPANFGARIDYVLCSDGWKDWFYESNIQEGLMGSDHCPVYAVMKDKVHIDGAEVDIKDIMNPQGMFKDGVRLRDWCQKDLVPASAKLIPEFDRRRSIRDMFAKKPLASQVSNVMSTNGLGGKDEDINSTSDISRSPNRTALRRESSFSKTEASQSVNTTKSQSSTPSSSVPHKISQSNSKMAALSKRPAKRSKSSSSKATPSMPKNKSEKSQSSLMGFFKSKTPVEESNNSTKTISNESPKSSTLQEISSYSSNADESASQPLTTKRKRENDTSPTPSNPSIASPSKPTNILESSKEINDPIAAKESWSKILTPRVGPHCEHNEPCVTMLTKKKGVNCGRSFFMCPRPLGPSGVKEQGTEWRCKTFIWSSDWSKSDAAGGSGG